MRRPMVDHSPIPERGICGPYTMAVAVLGCCHRELNAVYERFTFTQPPPTNEDDNPSRPLADLLVCCGDFQGLRSWEDFHSLAVPQKYWNSLGSF